MICKETLMAWVHVLCMYWFCHLSFHWAPCIVSIDHCEAWFVDSTLTSRSVWVIILIIFKNLSQYLQVKRAIFYSIWKSNLLVSKLWKYIATLIYVMYTIQKLNLIYQVYLTCIFGWHIFLLTIQFHCLENCLSP